MRMVKVSERADSYRIWLTLPPMPNNFTGSAFIVLQIDKIDKLSTGVWTQRWFLFTHTQVRVPARLPLKLCAPYIERMMNSVLNVCISIE